jgi:DNA mismatch repair protein MutL
MGRIHVLSEDVANKIAAGEVVERPASVVKELLENAIDAGARRVRVQVEAGGKKLIQVTDDGCGMSRDDAMLAFERHATSKILKADDLLTVSTLGFRGEALPSIASVSRLRLETALKGDAAQRGAAALHGTVIEINGGRMVKVEDAGVPEGTSINVRDLFYNIPARRKFLKAESTELSHIAQLVTHYALAHPEMHIELHSATNAMLVAPPVQGHADRIYQVFGKETLEQLVPVAATLELGRVGLPEPPPWKRDGDYQRAEPGEVRLSGFVSKPEIHKLNRNSIFVFVNGRLIRDRLVQHALTEAYRNILPPTVFPVVLLFLEMPFSEVDVNVHPSKIEVRFRQNPLVHDLVRDTVRAALMKARPAPIFTREIGAGATATPGLSPDVHEMNPPSAGAKSWPPGDFELQPPVVPPRPGAFQFEGGIELEGRFAPSMPAESFGDRGLSTRPANTGPGSLGMTPGESVAGAEHCSPAIEAEAAEDASLTALGTLKPLGQIRNSFILAVNDAGLWIIDQHVAHERILFEKILRQRATERVEQQRLLMPLIVELTPGQQAVFAEIADELRHNGFEVEPFGSRTIAVQAAPAGLEASGVERMLQELLEQFEREEQATNLDRARAAIAASIACHAAIKVNMPLPADKMGWLLRELAKTACPMTCPHGRPVVLRYSLQEIQKAFKRI